MSSTPEIVMHDWIAQLRPEASDRDLHIQKLRDYLVKGLSRSLGHRYGGHVPIEDIVQESLLKILHSLDSFQGRSQFLTWAMSIAVRVGISSLRRHYYRDVSLDLSASSLEVQIDNEQTALSADFEIEKLQMIRLLETLINETLSDRQRIAIQGTLDGLPIEIIAERLGSNRNAVYKLVHDARQRLRSGFEARGISAEDIQLTV